MSQCRAPQSRGASLNHGGPDGQASRLTSEQVEREIGALDTLDIAALRSRWHELYKNEPPAKVRSGFLRQAIAYRLQELAFGGLKPATLKQLRRLAESISASGKETADPPTTDLDESTGRRRSSHRIILTPGTRLMREWNGATELVEVLETGFGWRGKTFRTLSAVAVAITGTKWSGPKFFGLGTDHRKSAGRNDRPRIRSINSSDLLASLETLGDAS